MGFPTDPDRAREYAYVTPIRMPHRSGRAVMCKHKFPKRVAGQSTQPEPQDSWMRDLQLQTVSIRCAGHKGRKRTAGGDQVKHPLVRDGFTSMAASATDATDSLVEIARAAPRDLRQQDVEALQLTLDSTLDHDLGLDSLTRVELFARIEQELRVRLPDSQSDTAETLRDIAATLAGASRAGTIAKRRVPLNKPIAAAPPRASSHWTRLRQIEEHVRRHAGIPTNAESCW